MELRPDSWEEVSEDYVLKRVGGLKHFTHRYGVLNPEVDHYVSRSSECELDLDDNISEYPDNVQVFAETLGYSEKNFDVFELRDVVRTLHHSIYDEAARLKALKEDKDLARQTELEINDAFSLIVSLNEPDGRVIPSGEGVKNSSTEDERSFYEVFGDDIPVREKSGEFMPLSVDMGRRYQQIRDLPERESSLTDQEMQSIRSGLVGIEEFFSE